MKGVYFVHPQTNDKNKIYIGYKRTCDCKENKINCMTAKEWLKSQIGIWQFFYECRDIRDKELHPATYPISLAKKCIELFTHEGELVVDPFVGSGTTLIAARDINRNAVGFDLQQKYIDLCNERLKQQSLFSDTKQIPVCDDALNIPDYIKKNLKPKAYIILLLHMPIFKIEKGKTKAEGETKEKTDNMIKLNNIVRMKEIWELFRLKSTKEKLLKFFLSLSLY